MERTPGVTRATAALVVGFGLLAALHPAAASARKLYPVDEGRTDASFRTFRQSLVAALRRGDRQFVLSSVDPKIISSFGGENGLKGFNASWGLDSPKPDGWNRLRDTLLPLLALGGSSSEGQFWAPYVYSKWPEGLDADDKFQYACVVKREAEVRASASPAAAVLERLTYDILKLPVPPGMPDSGAWVKIVTPAGKTGYVARRDLRTPGDYRAGFKKVRGKWRMTALVSGD